MVDLDRDPKQWNLAMKAELVDYWNRVRTDVPKIKLTAVRTPCRLRQVIDALKQWESNKRAG